ncbi:MAG: gamma-glutamyltransferase [Hyphomicrobiales bacterium]
MRDLEKPGRSQVVARNGMAATSHPLSTLAAVSMLQAGGNAMDAAVAACAVQCVVEPGSTGIGGDCFALYMPKGAGRVVAFNGSGRLPAAATLDGYRKAVGDAAIPRQSPFAVTIPGAIDAWHQLLRDHGTKTLADVLKPAIALAHDGYAISERVYADWAEQEPVLAANANAARLFLVNGKAPAIGTVHRQKELARTFEAIAAGGRDAFYKGPIAEDMVETLRGLGGVHTLADFEAARGDYVDPISTTFRGRDIFECPPNGQGIVALIILNILAGFKAEGSPVSLERYHREIEATRLAYAVRNAALADPTMARVPVDDLLSSTLADRLRNMIRPGERIDPLPSYTPPAHNDTVYITVVDKDRNAASFINSTFHTFGAGIATAKTGIVLHNRGISFSLEEGHPNAVAPKKRPMHTIIPGMAVHGGRAAMPFGVMGGHYQAMGHASFISKVYDYGMDMQEAMSLPRVFPLPGTSQVEYELTLDPGVAQGLKDMGYELVRPARPIGGSQAIAIDWANGVLTGASDPRKDGCALGY